MKWKLAVGVVSGWFCFSVAQGASVVKTDGFHAFVPGCLGFFATNDCTGAVGKVLADSCQNNTTLKELYTVPAPGTYGPAGFCVSPANNGVSNVNCQTECDGIFGANNKTGVCVTVPTSCFGQNITSAACGCLDPE